MRALVFDPFSGISGDMVLGGLLDLGLPVDWLRSFVDDLGIARVEVDAERVDRNGIAATLVRLRLPHEHAHRHLADVLRIIEGCGAPVEAKERAIRAFTILAEAEADVHGTTPDRVHFHEVGALDAIVDILGAMAGCAELGFTAFYTRPVTLGRGWQRMEHGNFPVPPPAVWKLLEGVPARDLPFEGECTTPTGAAILRVLTGGLEPPGTFRAVRSGFGAGSRDPNDRPNCLRLVEVEGAPGGPESLLLLQADVDDMPAEYVPPLVESLLSAGAADCTVLPTLMKKGRPGLRIEVLAEPGSLERLRTILFRESSSIGSRWWMVDREALARREEVVAWKGQEVRVKRTSLPGGGERAKPEFEDVTRAAAALGVTPFAAYRAMLADGIAAEE